MDIVLSMVPLARPPIPTKNRTKHEIQGDKKAEGLLHLF